MPTGPANKYLSKGATISVAAGVIAGAKKITTPEDDVPMWDATDLLSTDTVEIPTGYTHPGKVSFEIFFDSAAHGALMADKYAKTLVACVITGPTQDAYTFTFSGYVTKCQSANEVAKGTMGTVEISLTSPAIYAGHS